MLPKVSLAAFEEVTRQSRFDRRRFIQRVVDRICAENEILGLLLEQRSGEGIDLFGFCIAYESMRLQSVADLREKRDFVGSRAKALVSSIEDKILGSKPSLMAQAFMDRTRPLILSGLAERLLEELPELPVEDRTSSAPLLVLPRNHA